MIKNRDESTRGLLNFERVIGVRCSCCERFYSYVPDQIRCLRVSIEVLGFHMRDLKFRISLLSFNGF